MHALSPGLYLLSGRHEKCHRERQVTRLWAVRHRDGWCLARYVKSPEGRDNVKTVCKHVIVLPWDVRPAVQVTQHVLCRTCRQMLQASGEESGK
jgi:hypothetical protein